MNIKNKLKNSALFPILNYSRYLINRYIVDRRFNSFVLYKGVNIEAIEEGINFFGYYNISPQNKNNEIVFLKVNEEKTRGSLYNPASIMLKNANGIITKIAETKAWNWQQGCMLQWYAESNDKIIFNNYSEEKQNYISIIQDINTGIKKTINSPIYSVTKSGKFALTLNFERLALMRPDYGYFNKNISWKDMPDDKNDGIWYIDIEKNTKKLIISLNTLKNYRLANTMINAQHKVNHIDIAPNGKRFMFLHRWVGPQGRFMRLLIANTKDGSDLRYITGDKMVSHNCWKNNDEIISFCRTSKGVDRYVLFNDKKKTETIIGERDFNKDGHPSVSPNGRWMLTDDYPDKSRFSRLYLYDLLEKKKHIIGSFYQPLKYTGERRIDLHPKWNLKGNRIYFESGHNNNRKLYAIDLKQLLI